MKDIVSGLECCFNEGKRAVIATIIQVKGSAYRREGARCIIYETGEIEGIISGGCVESDLLEHAQAVLESNQPKKLYYDFRLENDDLWGLGLGCNGAITIWLEPFDPINQKDKSKQLLTQMKSRVSTDVAYCSQIVIDSADPDQLPVGYHWTSECNEQNNEQTGVVKTEVKGIEVTLFTEVVKPLPRLFIIGSGPDAALLAKRANELLWKVTVIDHREANLTRHFSFVDHKTISRGDYGSINYPTNSYVVIMNHHFELDQLALCQLVPVEEITYVGVLGSRERISRLRKGLEDTITLSDMEKIHSPVGLDIGAETPEEIMISIMSELISHKNKRPGGSLCKTLN